MNLTIRRLRPDDAGALYRLLSDPKVMRHLEPPFDRARSDAFLREAGLCEPPLIYAALEGARLIGSVMYHPYDEESYELGWVLFPEYWGRGYASELTDRLISWARKAQKGVVIECVPEQAATVHLAAQKGFRMEGITDGLAVYQLMQKRTMA